MFQEQNYLLRKIPSSRHSKSLCRKRSENRWDNDDKHRPCLRPAISRSLKTMLFSSFSSSLPLAFLPVYFILLLSPPSFFPDLFPRFAREFTSERSNFVQSLFPALMEESIAVTYLTCTSNGSISICYFMPKRYSVEVFLSLIFSFDQQTHAPITLNKPSHLSSHPSSPTLRTPSYPAPPCLPPSPSPPLTSNTQPRSRSRRYSRHCTPESGPACKPARSAGWRPRRTSARGRRRR